jgi:hypothetical protein
LERKLSDDLAAHYIHVARARSANRRIRGLAIHPTRTGWAPSVRQRAVGAIRLGGGRPGYVRATTRPAWRRSAWPHRLLDPSAHFSSFRRAAFFDRVGCSPLRGDQPWLSCGAAPQAERRRGISDGDSGEKGVK